MLISKSKIYQTLNVLSKKERTKLISSLTAKQNQNHLKLTKILFDLIDNKISVGDKEELFEIVFPDNIYEDNFFRLLMSEVVTFAEDILVLSQLEKDKNRYQFYLLKAFSERDLGKYASPALEEFEKQLQRNKVRDTTFHELSFMLEEEKYKLEPNKSRAGFDFNAMSNHLDYHFISERLRISSLMATQDKILKREIGKEKGSLTVLLPYIENNPELLKVPAIKLFYSSYLLVHNSSNQEYLDDLTQSIVQYKDLFQKNILKDMLLIAINFCIDHMNKGNGDFAQKAFDLYVLGMENNLLLEKGNLTRFTLKNIITLGIRLNKYEWTDKFIKDNIHLIDKKYREGTLAYSLGYLAFEMKDYEKAALLLRNEASHDDHLLHLAAKNLLMKVYYLQNEMHLLELLLGSMNSYLKRKKIGGNHFDNYTNILFVMRKLIILKQMPKGSRKSMLKKLNVLVETMKSLNPLTEQKWILEQCNELANAH